MRERRKRSQRRAYSQLRTLGALLWPRDETPAAACRVPGYHGSAEPVPQMKTAASTPKLNLPKGGQTFCRIREGRYCYVDKTAYALRLAEEGDIHYFPSRPLRFGKSLFLDTIKDLYEGNEALFQGLAFHDRWDWSARHPVVRLSYAGGNFVEQGLVHRYTLGLLDDIGRRAGTEPRYDTVGLRLRNLLTELHRQAGHRMVVLVEECDKPILDALGDGQVAEDNRGCLRGLFGAIKDCDAHIETSFVTGRAGLRRRVCSLPRTSSRT